MCRHGCALFFVVGTAIVRCSPRSPPLLQAPAPSSARRWAATRPGGRRCCRAGWGPWCKAGSWTSSKAGERVGLGLGLGWAQSRRAQRAGGEGRRRGPGDWRARRGRWTQLENHVLFNTSFKASFIESALCRVEKDFDQEEFLEGAKDACWAGENARPAAAAAGAAACARRPDAQLPGRRLGPAPLLSATSPPLLCHPLQCMSC